MIILLGPDNSGKTTLMKRLYDEAPQIHTIGGLQKRRRVHATQDTQYDDYIRLLRKISSRYRIFDRFWMCDYPYADVVRSEEARFSLKQMHNLLWFTLGHNPLVILCRRMAKDAQWEEEYSSKSQFEPLLRSYKDWLEYWSIPYMTYNVRWKETRKEQFCHEVLNKESQLLNQSAWWNEHLRNGYFGVGSHRPNILLLAEKLSPNNKNLIPFEAGPSGRFMSTMFDESGIPSGEIWVTNLKKTISDSLNLQLFERELAALRPRAVLMLGRVAQAATPIVNRFGIAHDTLTHPSAVVRFHKEDIPRYLVTFRKKMDSLWWTERRMEMKGQKDGWTFRSQ